jgi:hypothetical protein
VRHPPPPSAARTRGPSCAAGERSLFAAAGCWPVHGGGSCSGEVCGWQRTGGSRRTHHVDVLRLKSCSDGALMRIARQVGEEDSRRCRCASLVATRHDGCAVGACGARTTAIEQRECALRREREKGSESRNQGGCL